MISFLGGLVGAVFMDVAESMMTRVGITSGVSAAYLGRWVLGFRRGVFYHSDIASASAHKSEQQLGYWFHLLVGGGLVALAYPILLLLINESLVVNHLFGSLLFGLLTCVLPWLVLMPAFGWGWFGRVAASGARPVVSPILSHIAYGLGLGLTLMIYFALVAGDK
ncbi:MAG: DUF2938 family protein [Gammaproteobacteria bacterium]|nr:DUF2938 family protein [Gammaproteobacteria bacterium]